ncbi:MAG: hypothetical protein FVQ82_15855 [Planctomycetes bacterium]|nr:hypothetical protein [Planctomycetota bacterium]
MKIAKFSKDRKTIMCLVFFSVLANGLFSFAHGDQELDQDDIQVVLKAITSKPRMAWIDAGTIAAMHYNFDPKTGNMIVTAEEVKFDKGRFRWEINIKSYESPKASKKQAVDVEWNTNRIFVWDGTTYSLYFKSGKQAILSDGAGNTQYAVNGPLTAGIVPWGHGIYTLDKLKTAVTSVKVDKQSHLLMSIGCGKDCTIYLEMDPKKDLAVISQIIERPGKSRIIKKYTDYTNISNFWIPSTIMIESYDLSDSKESLITSDYWDFSSVDLTPCSDDQFKADYNDNTYVEYRTSEKQALSYRHKSGRNTKSLLQKKLNKVKQSSSKTHNCATLAIEHAAGRLGKSFQEDELGSLISGPKKETSLYQLHNFTQANNLNSIPITGDIKSIASIKNCQVILHLSEANHYVVLDHLDNKYVWLVDLDSDKFYYRTSLSQFALEWKNRTALLISKEPLDIPDGCTVISENELHKIKGSAEGFGTYSCTDLIQEYDIQFCSQFSGMCLGTYVIWFNRCGCELNSEGGFCVGDKLAANVYTVCIEDPYIPGSCTYTGDWFVGNYIHACK